MSNENIEEHIKELERKLKSLKAIAENPEAKNEYVKILAKEEAEKRVKELKLLEDQRSEAIRAKYAADLQKHFQNLSVQMGINPDDFKKRLDRGDFQHVMTYVGLKDYLPFFERKLKDKEEKEIDFRHKGMSIHLKYLKETIGVLRKLINLIKTPYDLSKDYRMAWIKAGSDPDLGIEKIEEIYIKLFKVYKVKNLKLDSDMDYGGSVNSLRKYLECKKYLPDIEANLPKLKNKIIEFGNKEHTVIIERVLPAMSRGKDRRIVRLRLKEIYDIQGSDYISPNGNLCLYCLERMGLPTLWEQIKEGNQHAKKLYSIVNSTELSREADIYVYLNDSVEFFINGFKAIKVFFDFKKDYSRDEYFNFGVYKSRIDHAFQCSFPESF